MSRGYSIEQGLIGSIKNVGKIDGDDSLGYHSFGH